MDHFRKTTVTRVAIAALAGLCATAPATVTAQENPDGPYVGVGWGQFNVDVDTLDDAGTAATNILSADDNAWKAFAGWRFSPFLGVELAYVDLGTPTDRFEASGSNGNYSVDISGFAPYLVATIPLGPVEVFGKAGYYFYDVDLEVDLDSPGPAVRSSSSSEDLVYGVGAALTTFGNLVLRAEYERIDLEDAGNSDAFWLSGVIRF